MGENAIPSTAKIYCAKGSYAESYAIANSIAYENIAEELKQGDVNSDGSITSYDATQVLLCASGLKDLTDDQKKAADINGDNQITSYDATRILLMASGLV